MNLGDIFKGLGSDIKKVYNTAKLGTTMLGGGLSLESLLTPDNIEAAKKFLTPEMIAGKLAELSGFITALEAQHGKKFFVVLENDRKGNPTVNVDIYQRTGEGTILHFMAIDLTNITPLLTIVSNIIVANTNNGTGHNTSGGAISAPAGEQ